VIPNTPNPEEETPPLVFDTHPAGYDGTQGWEQEQEWNNLQQENCEDETCLDVAPESPSDSVLTSCHDAAVVGGALARHRMTASTPNAHVAFSYAAFPAAVASTVPMGVLPKGGCNAEMTLVFLDRWKFLEG
jgi:hypothetical protein